MKHKKGDKVKIAIDNMAHFEKGTTATIMMVDELPDILLKYFIENNHGIGCWVLESEIEIL